MSAPAAPAAPGGTGGRRLRAMAVTASNRAAAGVYEDHGGPLIVAALRDLGFAVDGPRVVPDGEPVGIALREAAADGYDLVVTTGGTGISPTDRTPEVTRAVLDYEVPGIAEAIRAAGSAKVPTAVLSRGVAGVSGRTLVVNLPGSTGGVKEGLAVLAPIAVHAVDQINGGDHASSHPSSHPSTGTSGHPSTGTSGHPITDASSHKNSHDDTRTRTTHPNAHPDDHQNDHPDSVPGRPS